MSRIYQSHNISEEQQRFIKIMKQLRVIFKHCSNKSLISTPLRSVKNIKLIAYPVCIYRGSKEIGGNYIEVISIS